MRKRVNALSVIKANSSKILLWNNLFKSWRCFTSLLLVYIQSIFYVTANTLQSVKFKSFFLVIVATYKTSSLYFFTSHLMLEALDGFIIVLGTDGHILYTRYTYIYTVHMYCFLSCPEQLNRWHCPLLGPSVTTNNQSLQNTTEWT